MNNMKNLMKQAQKMQADVAKVQAELAEKLVEATAGGGVVKVTVTGHKELRAVEIDPAAVDPEDVEMLQDLILVAVNEGLKKADDLAASEMSRVTGGMKMPF